MACNIRFLAVGNGDCIVVRPDNDPAVVVDIANARKLSETLDELGIKRVAWLFVTHEHSDHFPPLEEFERFLSDWINRGGKLEFLSLPMHLVTNAANRLRALKASDPKRAERLKRAIDKLGDYHRTGVLKVLHAEQGAGPYSVGRLRISVLHPSYIFEEIAASENKAKPNVTSLVLHLQYGLFTALLLGDLEGPGVAECLQLPPGRLRASVLKIPHHGAWPVNGLELEKLLNCVRPQLAVLSVGSTNRYKHVVPKLFDTLIKLREEFNTEFVCTEVTRTCARPVSERSTMGNTGLATTQFCAGDVHVVAKEDGAWERLDRTKHATVIASVPHAACSPRVDLGLLAPSSLVKKLGTKGSA